MSWEDLRYLEALSSMGTVQAAARELGVSASTVYRRIAALESDIGSACLKKGGDVGELTGTGGQLVKLAHQINEGLSKIRRQSEQVNSEVSGRITLTTVDGMLPLLLEPIGALHQRYPNLCINLVLGDSGPSVRKFQADVAIGVMSRPPEELISRCLFPIQYRVYGTRESSRESPLHWIVRGAPIAFTPEADWEKENAMQAVVSTGGIGAIVRLVRSGIGVALMPTKIASLYPELVELPQFQPSIESIAKRQAWLLVHPEMRNIPRVRAVWEALKDWFDE